MKLLVSHPWPGNIREMRHVLERAAQIAQHSPLTVHDLELQHPGNGSASALLKPSAAAMETNLTMREMETRYIELVLTEEDSSIDRAAKRSGISRSSLYSKVKNKEVGRPWTGRDVPPLLRD